MGRVSQLQAVLNNGSEQWHAAADEGIFSSLNQGITWSGGPVATEKMFAALDVEGKAILATTEKRVFLSSDGTHWEELFIPQGSAPVKKVLFGPNSSIWLVTRLGVFRSSDLGQTWRQITVQDRRENLSYVAFDRSCGCLLALDSSRTKVLESFDSGDTWSPLAESPRPLRNVTLRNQELIAVTDFDGLVATPIVANHTITPAAVSSLLK